MIIMVDEPDESFCLFGAEALLERLQKMNKEISRVREAEDTDPIHDMRVASRRVRSALRLFGQCFDDKDVKVWNKKIKKVRKALGNARDADVQIEFIEDYLDGLGKTNYRHGIARLLLRLRQKRERLQGKVNKSMDKLESSSILSEMTRKIRRLQITARMHQVDKFSPYLYQQAYFNISIRLEDMLAYEPYVNQSKRKEEHHSMRIAVKRLRYTMEIFEPLYDDELKEPIKTMRKIQTLLGDIHDCDVWVDYVPQFLEEEQKRTMEYYGHLRAFPRLRSGILYLKDERQKHRMELHQEFVNFWQDLQQQNIWDNLLKIISKPLPQKTGGES
ncbi:CHAD domain-containing protein [Candidatus Poribacteria bacterium]|nr:CHAD domain-containing protein [Candidatus Poribacteria bacterium]